MYNAFILFLFFLTSLASASSKGWFIDIQAKEKDKPRVLNITREFSEGSKLKYSLQDTDGMATIAALLSTERRPSKSFDRTEMFLEGFEELAAKSTGEKQVEATKIVESLKRFLKDDSAKKDVNDILLSRSIKDFVRKYASEHKYKQIGIEEEEKLLPLIGSADLGFGITEENPIGNLMAKGVELSVPYFKLPDDRNWAEKTRDKALVAVYRQIFPQKDRSKSHAPNAHGSPKPQASMNERSTYSYSEPLPEQLQPLSASETFD